MFNSDWYNSLNKPFLAPPDSVFAPVWSILYAMILISLILYLQGGFRNKSRGIIYFTIQMLLNFSWTFVFFAMKNIGAALFVIILMWIFTALTISAFSKHSKFAAVLLIPYIIWISFAFYLNFGYLVLN